MFLIRENEFKPYDSIVYKDKTEKKLFFRVDLMVYDNFQGDLYVEKKRYGRSNLLLSREYCHKKQNFVQEFLLSLG